MLTLIPVPQKKTLIQEYKMRFVAVLLFFFASVCLVAGVFLLPSYILAKSKLRDVQSSELALQNSRSLKEEKALQDTLKNMQGELQLSKIVQPPPSKAIYEVTRNKVSGIKIAHLRYVYGPELSTLLVSGVANKRPTLIEFVNALKTDTFFSAVTFPISDLSEDKDIPFTITLTGTF